MTPIRRSSAKPRAGALAIARSVGEGFSIGPDWHFRVTEINARFVTLTVTSAKSEQAYTLGVSDSLHISAAGVVRLCSAADGQIADLVPIDVSVKRVTSNDARLAVRAPRALKIKRHERDMTTGVTA